MLNHAVETDFEEVKRIFYQHKSWFPHIRTDYIKRMISAGEIVFDRGVVITYHVYKRKTKIGNVIAYPGDCVLHQIAARDRDGSARIVLNDFFDYIGRNVFLSVRADNDIATKFYSKVGMELIGETSWAKGTLSGLVFLKRQQTIPSECFIDEGTLS